MKLLFTILAIFFLPALAYSADNQLSPGEKSQGWMLLFDGKTLDGWETSSETPSKRPVEDHCLNPHLCGGYMLINKKQWDNFILQCDFKITKDCNSGIFLRTFPLTPPPNRDVGWNGMEVQIVDTPTAGYTDTGAIYDLVKPTSAEMRPVGQWNHIKILCNRNLVEVELNGDVVTWMDIDDFTEPNKRPDGTEHKFDYAVKDRPRKGYIGLQDHGGDCWYKNIKIKPLK